MNDNEVESLDLGEWPLPENYLLEIGRVTVLWTSLEAFLGFCIGKLAGFNEKNPIPFILTNHLSFPQKLDMLASLCEYLAAEYPNLVEHKAVIVCLRSAQKERNKFTHNGMSLDKKSNEIMMTIGSARGSIKTSIQKVSIANIRKASIAIDEAQTALYKLVLKQDVGPAWKRCTKPNI